MNKNVIKFQKTFYKLLFKINFLNRKEKYYKLYCDAKLELNKIIKTRLEDFIEQKFSYLTNTAIPAAAAHRSIFAKYKNSLLGKEVVLMGSGPSLNKYTAIPNAIHIGVNTVFKFDNVKLDYLFIQDFLIGENIQTEANLYTGNNCKKFYGMHSVRTWECCQPISEFDLMSANAERYYFQDLQRGFDEHWSFVPDISLMPLTSYSSVIFPAFQFALWTHPKIIYIVGCDCSATCQHFSEIKGFDSTKKFPSQDNILYGWQKAKLFADRFYPDVEILNINPEGLKNLFPEAKI